MKRIWITLLFSMFASAEIIDGVAISVGSDVITISELREEVRVTAFLNREQLQFTSAVLRETGERMVDQLVIRTENATSRFGSATEQEVAAAMDQIVRERFQGDRGAYTAALARYELTQDIVKEHVRWQLIAMRYISVRFTTGVQIRTEDVEAYFKREIRPKLPPEDKSTAEDYRDRIEEILLQERANEQTESWIREVRRALIVDFNPEVFR
jgi:deoxyhypusine synthase